MEVVDTPADEDMDTAVNTVVMAVVVVDIEEETRMEEGNACRNIAASVARGGHMCRTCVFPGGDAYNENTPGRGTADNFHGVDGNEMRQPLKRNEPQV